MIIKKCFKFFFFLIFFHIIYDLAMVSYIYTQSVMGLARPSNSNNLFNVVLVWYGVDVVLWIWILYYYDEKRFFGNRFFFLGWFTVVWIDLNISSTERGIVYIRVYMYRARHFSYSKRQKIDDNKVMHFKWLIQYYTQEIIKNGKINAQQMPGWHFFSL